MKKYYMFIISVILCIIASVSFFEHYGFPVFSTNKEKQVIVIDVGHGGTDPGKVSASGIEEKDVNLQIALFLKDYLIAQDYIVYLTRETDCGLYDDNVSNKKTSDLNNRIRFFNDKNAAYMVSIHQNSYPDTIQHGAQTFYFTNSEVSKAFAESIQTSLLKIDNTNTRSAKSSDSYFLLKHSSMPAVIVECGFLSNPEEAARLTDPNYQKQLAYAICMGVCTYDSTH